jgi:SAM-dependent methyltransferase
MENGTSDFDDAYRSARDYFGDKPEKLLVDFAHLIDSRRPALDVGSGQGRNAVFLAKSGIAVDAIDPSGEAVKSTSALAREGSLPIRSWQSGFESFEPQTNVTATGDFDSYGAICLFGLIQILAWDSIELLRDRVSVWSGPGTVLFVTAWTTDDPSFAICTRERRSIGKNSFADDSGNVRTFLQPGEASGLFEGFGAVYLWEGMGPIHRHGDGPEERHGKVEAVLVK